MALSGSVPAWAKRRAVALRDHCGSVRIFILGPYVHALGDASNLPALYAFVVGVLAQHYGSRVSGIKPWLAVVAALLSVLAFCYYGTCKQTAPVLKLEC